jgi:hypothetical protein
MLGFILKANKIKKNENQLKEVRIIGGEQNWQEKHYCRDFFNQKRF